MGRHEPWAALPVDILAIVMEALARADRSDLSGARLVCRSWRDAIGLALQELKPLRLTSYQIDSFPAVSRLDLSSCRGRVCNLAAIRGIKNLSELTLSIDRGQRIDQLAVLRDLTQLTSLKLVGFTPRDVWGRTDSADKAYAPIKELVLLKKLMLLDLSQNDPLPRAEIWSSMSNLTYLSISVKNITWGRPAQLFPSSSPSFVTLPPRLQSFSSMSAYQPCLGMMQSLVCCADLRSLKLGSPVFGLDCEHLGLLTSLTRLTELHLYNAPDAVEVSCYYQDRRFSAGKVAQLAVLESLEVLVLVGCRWSLDKAQLHCVSALTRLRDLTIATCQVLGFDFYGRRRTVDAAAFHVNNETVQHFPLSQLTSLRLSTGEGPAILPDLSSAAELRHLQIQGYQYLPYCTLQGLQGLTQLQSLEVKQCGFSDLGVAIPTGWLKNLNRLTSLHWQTGFNGIPLISTEYEEDDMEIADFWVGLEALTALERLVVDGTAVRLLSSFRMLWRISALQHLELTCSEERPASLSGFLSNAAELKDLSSLSLSGITLDEPTLQTIRALTGLTALALSSVADEDLAGLNESLSQLRQLSVCNSATCSKKLTKTALQSISKMSRLRKLTFRASQRPCYRDLKILSPLCHLRYLELNGCQPETVKGLADCTSLTKIRMMYPAQERFYQSNTLHSREIHAATWLQKKLPLLGQLHLAHHIDGQASDLSQCHPFVFLLRGA